MRPIKARSPGTPRPWIEICGKRRSKSLRHMLGFSSARGPLCGENAMYKNAPWPGETRCDLGLLTLRGGTKDFKKTAKCTMTCLWRRRPSLLAVTATSRPLFPRTQVLCHYRESLGTPLTWMRSLSLNCLLQVNGHQQCFEMLMSSSTCQLKVPGEAQV